MSTTAAGLRAADAYVSATEVSVEVNHTAGAPGPTAVFYTATLPDEAGCVQILRRAYPALRRQVAFSKALFAAPAALGRFHTRFLQLREPDKHGCPAVYTRRDCVNSTVAAYPALYRTTANVTTVNVDTGLTVTLRPAAADRVSVCIAPPAPISPSRTSIPIPSLGRAEMLAMQVNNPYVLADAATAGLTAQDLLDLDGPAKAALLHPLEEAAAQVRAVLDLPDAGGGLPKLALVAADDRTGILTARTIYQHQWHPGLPLTAAVTFFTATQIPGSPWHRPAVLADGLLLRTPAGLVRVTADLGPGRTLTSFHVPDREVYCHVSRHRC